MKRINNFSVALLCGSLLLTGCGASSVSTSESISESYGLSGGAVMASARTAAAVDSAAYEEAEVGDNDYGYDEVSAEAGVTEGTMVSSDRKLIKTYYISLETTTFDDTVDTIRNRAVALGGYVESSSVSGTSIQRFRSGERYAYIIVRVPTDKVDQYLEEAENAGNVTRREEEVEDITLRYTDTESYLEALKTEQSRLLELIAEAQTVEDLIALNSRLTEVERQIESNTRQIRLYDNQIEYTSVTFNIDEVELYSPTPEEGIIDRMKRGIRENLSGLTDGAADLAVWLVSSIPTLIFLVVICIFAFLIGKKIGLLKRISKLLSRIKKKHSGDAAGTGPDQ